MSYSVLAYCGMVGDRVRAEAYAAALRQEVRDGCTVVEVGTGTGVFALLAAQMGAAKVYAIETDAAITVGRELAAANGLSDRVHFIRGSSTEVELPERADLLLSDMRGVLPLLGDHLPTLFDARKRFLKPGGRMIPLRDRLFAAVVEAEKPYTEYVTQWEANHFDLDVAPVRQVLVNTMHRGDPKATRLLTTPAVWATLDYVEATSPHAAGEVSWEVETDGTAHGLHLWFDGDLAEGITLSNAPGETRLVYGSNFAPFLEPVTLEPGDVVEVALSAHLVAGDYVWRWTTRVLAGGDAARPKASFDQSTFHATLVEPEDLAKRGEAYVPELGVRGAVDRLILQRMGEGLPLGAIAREVATLFPERYASWQAALVKVGELSVRYAK